MRYEQLIILLPCHSLEDFPLHHEGEDAEGLLAAWTALWHPVLIHAAQAKPTWARIDTPPENLANRLLVIPGISLGQIPAGFTSRAKNEGAHVVRKLVEREAILEEALGALAERPPVSGEAIADFLALGYCYLQVQLLTRQMRYASNLDEVYFNNQVVAAANAAIAGDAEQTRELLQSCFDVLAEERDHFYPVDSYLLDLTLVAETTLGESLRKELAGNNPINLLLSGETLSAMEQQEPETVNALKTSLEASRVSLVGGEFHEGRAILLSPETLLAEMQRGLGEYQRVLGKQPRVFGRRRFGLGPMWPQIVKQLGFESAVHSTFDGGQFPDGAQTKSMWVGGDGTELPSLARPSLDATRPETFLKFCLKLGESMDSDHVATIYFSHWPGQASRWFDELRRVASWTSALGKFCTAEEYFETTSESGLRDQFEADYYRTPYLKQDVGRNVSNPLSTISQYTRRVIAAQQIAALTTLTTLLSGDAGKGTVSPAPGDDCSADEAAKFNQVLQATLDESLTKLAALIPRKGSASPGYMVFNPLGFVRRMLVEIPQLASPPTVERPIYATGDSGGVQRAVVDVPPLGFAWLTAGNTASKPQRALVEDRLLRNEFFEVQVDDSTGALRSLHDYKTRGNRLSHQLALRIPPAANSRGGREDEATYSVMVAESVEVTASDAAVGEITSRGRLVDRQGRELAKFRQAYRAVRGSRVLHIDVELTPGEELKADPWNSYYCARFAWPDEGGELFRTMANVRVPVSAKRFEAPLYVDVCLPKHRLAILTGGLPYHRLTEANMLDTLLLVRGEMATKFSLGVVVDPTHPLQDAIGFLAPPLAIAENRGTPAAASSSWLFHIDAKNVVATNWQPLLDDGKVVGFLARVQEVYGRPATVTLSAFRKVASARRIKFDGEQRGVCEVSGDQVKFSMGPQEWTTVEVRW